METKLPKALSSNKKIEHTLSKFAGEKQKIWEKREKKLGSGRNNGLELHRLNLK